MKLNCVLCLYKNRLSKEFSSTSSYYPTISGCSTSCLYSTSWLPPRGFWPISLSQGLMPFSSSVWVIYGIHGHSKNGWSYTHPTRTSCLSNNNLIVIDIGNNSDSCVTFLMYSSNFSRRKLNLGIFSLLCNNSG